MSADPFVEPHIQHGLPNLRIAPEQLNGRSREPDSLQLEYQNESASAYPVRGLITGYDYLPIVERQRTQDGPVYKYRLTLEGLADAAETWRETDFEESSPEEGWDEIRRQVFTRDPTNALFVKGNRLRDTALTSVTGEADDDKLTKTAHGLVTGQLFDITFASGFTGLTSGSYYYAIRIDADNIKAATTLANALASTAIDITADGTGATITPVRYGYEFLFITDRAQRTHRAAGYYEIAMMLKGLKGSKPYKRRINGNVVSSTSRFDGYSLLEAVRWEDFPPVDSETFDELSGTDIEVEYDAASLQISDTYLSSDPPPFDKIGQPWTPPDPPDVTVFVLVGVVTKYFWPFNWVCNAMPCEKLAGADIWLITVNYQFKVLSIPVAS